MRKKWWIGILVPLLAIFIAAGCGNQGGDESSTQDNEQSRLPLQWRHAGSVG